MSEQNDKGHPPSRVKRRSNTSSTIAIVVAVLLVVGLYFYLQKSPFISVYNGEKKTNDIGDTQQPGQAASPLSGPVTVIADNQQGQKLVQTQGSLPASDTESRMSKHTINGVDSPEPIDSMRTSEKKSKIQTSVGDPQQLIDEINSFYAHLDQQSYMQSYGMKESSKAHFSKFLQKLVDNPPVVFRETDDLFTLLQNTAHFFRILGKDNINILKGILDRERNSFEKILHAFYGLTYHPEYLKEEYSLSIPAHALTDYAGFFLNTMGGRLYLFRRDSTSRMLVSYYAIIIIDRANDNGNGAHGIDLRPAILSLIEDIEIGGSQLKLKEEYLDVLYDFQEKYN